MQSAAGIFTTRQAAESAAEELRAIGLPQDDVAVLIPGTAGATSPSPSRTPGETSGMGAAIGSVVGTAVGTAAGLPIGAAAASTLVIPGIGPVLALGIAGGVLLGLTGGAAGNALEHALADRVPKDHAFLYEDALRCGRSVVVALSVGDTELDAARAVLARAGAETIETARERWWSELRDAERTEYRAGGGDFDADEIAFRRGFEAAQSPAIRGLSFGEAQPELRTRYPEPYDTVAFRRGFDRGRDYHQRMRDMRAREAA